MKPIVAINKFFQAEPNGFKPPMREFKEFRAACSDEEWHEFAEQAAAYLNVELG